MRTKLLASLLCAGLLAFLLSCTPEKPTVQTPAQASAGGDASRITGPQSHKNLTIFLIHGPDTIKGDNYLTLGEALEQKKLVVYETDNVNELAIENVSDQPVFIQSGDIVKGGKQDRTMGSDLIASAHSGRISIAAFCVEAGRWEQRGGESQALFSGSSMMVAGPELKLYANANTKAADQGLVWSAVKQSQAQLSESTGGSVASTTSPSSFQLALENSTVQSDTDEYIEALEGLADRQDDVIGYAAVVNGRVTSADVYASHALFKKVWPKLLRSSAVEALGVAAGASTTQPVASVQDVRKFLVDAEKAKAERKQVNARTAAITYDSNDSVMLQTDDMETGAASVRRTYIRKSPTQGQEGR